MPTLWALELVMIARKLSLAIPNALIFSDTRFNSWKEKPTLIQTPANVSQLTFNSSCT